ncbi:MAG: hypothetical protein AVDCRST_MAG28-97 [uncultured Rubrobacteraceae bacterium]|uniref:Uncharacterized protein n=1 Tax=uncultured Rubrobacteraceae bacterium TaxID=349277 RepID=A0A6J4Q8I9_9ACTN|nr:MAG: hypothetical protein AVDCRST_MAG28-97 [uncultured Rubrobacteraceae bacterium]
MGRADVLLRFLQLISKDSPRELDPYLENLDNDTEERPLVDQIVDSIVAGDEKLYEKYAQARRQVSTRNPYASAEEAVRSRGHEEALGFFMSRWATLESTLRRKSEKEQLTTGAPQRWSSIVRLLQRLDVPEPLSEEINYIRQIRNQVVHGVETPSEEELRTTGRFLEEIVRRLEDMPNPLFEQEFENRQ